MDVEALRFGTCDNWTDLWATPQLRGIRRVDVGDVRTAREMLGDDDFDQVSVASMAEVAELRVWQADVALRQRRSQ